MKRLKIVIPKGRIFEKVCGLLSEAGMRLEKNDRAYRPSVSDGDVEVKIMKPQNIPKLVEFGSHDAGFTGHDWVVETGADVFELMDLGLDPVRIVAAVPKQTLRGELQKKRIVVASEYENITRTFLLREGFRYVFLRTYGTTEVFPPDDADMIIDNTATGKTLEEHGLKITDTLLESSTRFICNRQTLQDPWKREKIEEMKMLFCAILNARERIMLEMNIPNEKFHEIVGILPCMRSPTVSPLYGESGFAVKVAVRKNEVARLIPLLKRLGATDILEYELRKVIV